MMIAFAVTSAGLMLSPGTRDIVQVWTDRPIDWGTAYPLQPETPSAQVQPARMVAGSSHRVLITGPAVVTDLSTEPDGVDFHHFVWGGPGDYDGDGDVGTDADIEAFFRCLGGDCCPTCTDDFDGDGAHGTDADIVEFFRILGGG